MHLHHPLPKGPRALHEIAARSDAIAIGTIASVSEGRIQVHDAIDVSGAVPAEFEVKRAPSTPPLFQSGDRAVLLLRGARSPYLLADDPHENLVIPAGSEVEWILALRAFADARRDPAQLRGLYFDWLDGNNATLQDLAVRGLVDPAAPFQPISVDLLMDRARRAVDPSASGPVRNASASVAQLSPESGARLLHEVLQPTAAVDAAVYETALQGALLRQADPQEFSLGLGRGLRSEDASGPSHRRPLRHQYLGSRARKPGGEARRRRPRPRGCERRPPGRSKQGSGARPRRARRQGRRGSVA